MHFILCIYKMKWLEYSISSSLKTKSNVFFLQKGKKEKRHKRKKDKKAKGEENSGPVQISKVTSH